MQKLLGYNWFQSSSLNFLKAENWFWYSDFLFFNRYFQGLKNVQISAALVQQSDQTNADGGVGKDAEDYDLNWREFGYDDGDVDQNWEWRVLWRPLQGN